MTTRLDRLEAALLHLADRVSESETTMARTEVNDVLTGDWWPEDEDPDPACDACGSTDLEERVLVAAGPHFSPWPRVTTAIEEDNVTTAKGELRAKVCLACGAVELTERT